MFLSLFCSSFLFLLITRETER
jgi:hypothetical protein